MPQSLKKQWRRRVDCKLGHLNYERNTQLCEWLLTSGLSYTKVAEKIKEEWGADIRIQELCGFYKDNVVPYLIELRQKAVYVAMGYSDEIGEEPGQFSKVTMDALEQKAMQACWDKSVSAKELKVYLDLVMRWQEQRLRRQEIELKLRRLEVLERRQRKLERAFADNKLTNTEIAERCRIIFKQNGTIDLPKLEEKTPETGKETNIAP